MNKKIGFLILDKKNIKYYIGVCVIIVLTIWTWGYVSLLNSNEYAFSKDFIKSNPLIIENLGTINSLRPGFSNFKRNFSGGVWTSLFNVVADGEKKSGVISLKLTSTESSWNVENGELQLNDGNKVSLK